MITKPNYQQLNPSDDLIDVVDSFWNHINPESTPQEMTIIPDSFWKIVVYVRENRVQQYFMTGLWSREKEIAIPPETRVFGCRLKILAPEYLLGRKISSLLDARETLSLSFLGVDDFRFESFAQVVKQWEKAYRAVRPKKTITNHKLRLSRLLDETQGAIGATEVADQIFWSRRQINRYLNAWLGVSIKQYLNIQRCYYAYPRVREGDFGPTTDFYDQSHFIREVKKHTGETPSGLYDKQNDRFVQFRNIVE